ncbi:hypothetical protein [Klebsiella electrica]|uniref:HofO family protein n=1 Tax=Klebsiella/Raoultella group TaxID=2890311 RepID=UPI000C292F60|nr:hypothetical protein [Klebsiella electrica]MXF48601.1 hypothetical protein [Raoultella sp. Lac2]MXG01381.1 hypothetical protein [Raoultella sp. Lac1]PJR63176.1 hypothetical protein CWM52_12630 [Raoultella sp. T31]BBV74269.1 hypothetical protein STW0522RAO56_03230 [Raoultella planticola]WIO42905.1 hypothetical protein P2G42_24205 [Klebsiella electrica]
MQALIERGMTAFFSLRGGWLALPIVLGLVAVIFLRLPASPPPPETDGHLRLRQQWLRLMPLRTALQNIPPDERKRLLFSPIALPVSGAMLVTWRPLGRGGELLLEASWQAVPALFSWLAECGMRVTGFSLRPEKEALLMTLQLEAEDVE